MLALIFLSAMFFEPGQAMIPLREERIKIAIIDTGVNLAKENLRPFLCANGHKSFIDTEPLKDNHYMQHGTNIAGLIAQNLDSSKFCLLIIKFYANKEVEKKIDRGDEKVDKTLSGEIEAILYAIDQKVAFINMSVGGIGYNDAERNALLKAMRAGIKISVAAGNDANDLDKNCNYFPACYAQEFNPDFFHAVGSSAKDATGREYSNFGSIVKFKENGTDVGDPPNRGTSQSTAIHTGKWASGKVK